MSHNNSEEVKSAFDPDNFNMVLLIQMMRLYDIGIALLAAVDEEKAGQLVKMHEDGQTFTPAPAFSVEE